MQEIARLPVEERHKLLAPYIDSTVEDFFKHPELTEFSVLDGEEPQRTQRTQRKDVYKEFLSQSYIFWQN